MRSKASIYIVTLILLSVLFISCDDSVEVFSNKDNKYIVQCILRTDTSYQVLTLGKSFLENSEIAYELQKAEVIIQGNKQEYKFKLSSKGNSLIKNSRIYECENFVPKLGAEYFLKVKVDNKLLQAKTIIPNKKLYPFKTKMRIPNDTTTTFLWEGVTSGDKYFYIAKLFLKYKYNKFESRKIEIPHSIIEIDGEQIPQYMTLNQDASKDYDVEMFDYAFSEIVKDDPDKNNYSDFEPELLLYILNKDLAGSVFIQSNAIKEFTILIDNPDFNNIENGIGIFGAYDIWKSGESMWYLGFKGDYIRRLGFKTYQE